MSESTWYKHRVTSSMPSPSSHRWLRELRVCIHTLSPISIGARYHDSSWHMRGIRGEDEVLHHHLHDMFEWTSIYLVLDMCKLVCVSEISIESIIEISCVMAPSMTWWNFDSQKIFSKGKIWLHAMQNHFSSDGVVINNTPASLCALSR